jgi:hypothetical protein
MQSKQFFEFLNIFLLENLKTIQFSFNFKFLKKLIQTKLYQFESKQTK